MLKKILVSPTNRMELQFIRYGMVVAIAAPIDLGGYIILKQHMNYVLAATISFSISLVVNYFLSVRWVWTNDTGRQRHIDVIVFFVIGIVGLVLTDLVLWGLTEFAHINSVVSKLCALMVVFFWSFCARRYLFTGKVIRNERPANG
jgi:putative flippase GtrA